MTNLQITRPGVVLPVRPDPSGTTGPTRGQARGPKWRRSSPGLYVPADVDPDDLEQRIVEVAAGLPPGAVVTGWAALAWQETAWFNGRGPDGRTLLPVPVALDDRRTIARRPGVLLTNDWLFDGDVTWLDGLPMTIPARSVTFQARRARTLLEAVRVIDMAAAGDRVDLEELSAYASRLPSRPGLARLRTALGMANENVWSPQETTMRLVWRARGHPRPECNVPVFDHAGRHLLTPDLFDPDAGVAGEYDGAVHLGGELRRRDLGRDELYRDLEIEVVTMMSGDRRDTAAFERRLDAAYRRASRQQARPWTIDQPDWWVDTSTVARRLALSDDVRARWLRWQAA